MNLIPVHRPQLPTKNLIVPYLEKIDDARWYSNFGPLLIQFENRLAKHFNLANEMVVTAANGTLLLISIIKALGIPENTLCVMPSWTFTATPAAACYAGLIPYFVDVDKTTQSLDPLPLKAKLSLIDQPIGAVIVVAPFGAPIDAHAWNLFSEETGIPVIIDAAAAFDAVSSVPCMSIGKSPVMISLHATKTLGIGEGGVALSTDSHLIRKIKLNTSFGFNANRESLVIGYNAKLSEYAAAVGLAALDNWEQTRSQWATVRDEYIKELYDGGIEYWLAKEWVTSTCNIIIPMQAEKMMQQLREQGIDTRKWWGNGCHEHQAYQRFFKEKNLENTKWLSQSMLGLPFAVDLDAQTIKAICHIVKRNI